jgi:hypothetical protein
MLDRELDNLFLRIYAKNLNRSWRNDIAARSRPFEFLVARAVSALSG